MELRLSYSLAHNTTNQPSGFQTAILMPSLVIPTTHRMGPPWLRGRVEWNPELFLGLFTYPYIRPILGVSPVQFRYILNPIHQWSPYLMGGVGAVIANVERPETGSDYNVLISLAAGTQYTLTDKTSLILEYRHTHISNGGTHPHNSGIDSDSVVAGVSLKWG